MANANVAKKEETLPALNLSVMEQDASSGLENIHQEDLATPRFSSDDRSDPSALFLDLLTSEGLSGEISETASLIEVEVSTSLIAS